jgi:subtilisin-like proprotein convertase family protein
MKIFFTFLGAALANFAFAQSFTGSTCLIQDYTTNDGTAVVTGLPTAMSSTFGLESICFNITHTYDEDIRLILISPAGIEITILDGVGGGDDNFTNTCLRGTGNSISTGTAPFTGNFKALGVLGNLNSGNPNGNWILRTYDDGTGDVGTLNNWTLNFTNTPAQPFIFNQSNLPMVIINSNGVGITSAATTLCDFKIYYNTNGARNFTSNTPYFNGKAALNIRGNYSASLPQKPYSVEMQDVNGISYDTSLFNMPRESDFILLANYNDKTFLRNSLTYHLSEKMDHYASRTRHVDVMVDGVYQGIYLFAEKIKRDPGRVDVAKLDPTEVSGTSLTGGYITKIDYHEPVDSWQLPNSPPSNPGADIHMVYYYPKPAEIVPQQKTYIQNIWSGFESALYSPNFADPITGFRSFISETSWIDYLIIGEITRNVDSYKKSRFFHKEKDGANGTLGKIKAGPVWDFDWSLKAEDATDDMSDWSYDNLTGQDVNPPGYYIRMLQDPVFASKFKCRYSQFRLTILDTNYLFNHIDSMALYLNESQGWHYDNWGHLTLSNTSPEWTPTSFPDAMAKFKDFYRKRLAWIDANIPGSLQGCQFAGLNKIELPSIMRTFPNPTSELVNVQILASSEDQNLKIYDISGTLLFERKIESSAATTALEIETTGWANGMYTMSLIGNNGKTDQKLIVQH